MNKGFSIIELIIVLLISSIISTIVVPNYSKIQRYAKENNVKQQLYTLQLAIETYFLGEGQYPASTTIEELISHLDSSSLLKKLPENPFTGSPPSTSDTSGLIIYTPDQTQTTYSLEAFGINNEDTILKLNN